AQHILIVQFNRVARKSPNKMNQNRPLSNLFLLAIALVRASAFGEQATSPANASTPEPLPKQFTILQSVTGSRSLSNGIEIQSGKAVMQITALRDDLLRVRVGPQGQLPENASWAVLHEPRSASATVSPEEDSVSAGFHTTALRVRVERATMRLKITDLNGAVVQEDAANRPIEFHGPAFRVYKKMPTDE